MDHAYKEPFEHLQYRVLAEGSTVFLRCETCGTAISIADIEANDGMITTLAIDAAQRHHVEVCTFNAVERDEHNHALTSKIEDNCITLSYITLPKVNA